MNDNPHHPNNPDINDVNHENIENSAKMFLSSSTEEWIEHYLDTLKLKPEQRKELLYNPSVIAEIYGRIDYYASFLQVTKGFIVKKLLEIADYASANEEILDKNGVPTGKKKMRDVSVALKAVESLSKYSGLNCSITVNNAENQASNHFSPCNTEIENLDDSKI